MGQVIAVTGTKGGSGKSTLSVHLAVFLDDLGHRVALVDADYNQLTSSKWLGRMSHSILVEALSNHPEEHHRVREVRKIARMLKESHDFVIVDTKGEASTLTDAVLLMADLAIIPFQPSGPDIWELENALSAVIVSRQENQGKPAAYLVLNQTSPNDPVARKVRELGEAFGVPTARRTLKRLNAYRDAGGLGTVATRMSGKRSKNYGDAITELFEEVLALHLTPSLESAANG